MELSIWQLEMIPWYAFLIYWVVSAARLKQIKREEAQSGRLFHIAVIVVAFYLLFRTSFGIEILDRRFIPDSLTIRYLGIVLTWLGVGFAIWARYAIGANWSGRVTLKVDHQLVQSGPYAFVRHPIYTGLLLANVGAALFIGRWRCLLAIVIFLVEISRKALKEEGFMLSEFGDRYAEYRKRAGFLVPKFH
ncbi:MAG: isoprenylcysteine carboxylmethyltransferase family protein [Terriglobales bacterium]